MIKRMGAGNIINKHIRTTDNVDIGNVQTVRPEFIVVRPEAATGFFYIPKPDITSYDGSSSWINSPSNLVGPKFGRQSEPFPERI
jgi:hypothetical protein